MKTALIKIAANPNTPSKINHSFFPNRCVIDSIPFLGLLSAHNVHNHVHLIWLACFCFTVSPITFINSSSFVSSAKVLVCECIKTLFLQSPYHVLGASVPFLNIICYNYRPYRVFQHYKTQFSV